MKYWLCKTEPETYSFNQLQQDKSTNWNNVRNYQARNNLRLMKKNDLVLIYHSGDEKAVVGVASVIRESYPDIDPDGGEWVQVDLKAVDQLKNSVSLATIKKTSSLSDIALIKQSRLSVMQITKSHYDTILKLSK